MNTEIAKRFLMLREEANLSAQELADKLGITKELVLKWESAQETPDADNLMELSRIYNKSIDEILYSNSAIPEYDESKAVYCNSIPTAESRKVVGAEGTREKASFRLSLLAFPFVCLLVFLCLGFFGGLWHPGWLVFLAIPVYYGLMFFLRRIGQNVDKAVQEYVDGENNDDNID